MRPNDQISKQAASNPKSTLIEEMVAALAHFITQRGRPARLIKMSPNVFNMLSDVLEGSAKTDLLLRRQFMRVRVEVTGLRDRGIEIVA
jgi:hypothetical protein